jgi:hypothetical protein
MDVNSFIFRRAIFLRAPAMNERGECTVTNSLERDHVSRRERTRAGESSFVGALSVGRLAARMCGAFARAEFA